MASRANHAGSELAGGAGHVAVPASICVSVNEVHGVPEGRLLEDGGLVSVAAGDGPVGPATL